MKLSALIAASLLVSHSFVSATRGESSLPSDLRGNSAVVIITGGNGVLPSSGGYRIRFSLSSSGYSISGGAGGVPASNGSYVYLRTGGNRARLKLNPTDQSGESTTNLEFSTATSATFTLSGESGSQSGIFVLERPPSECGVVNLSMRAQVPIWDDNESPATSRCDD